MYVKVRGGLILPCVRSFFSGLTLSLVLAGCANSANTLPMPNSPAAPDVRSISQSAHRYMIGQIAVSAIAADPIASADLNGTKPYIIETNESGPYANSAPAEWLPIYVVRWDSEAQMAIDAPNVPMWVTVFMYDNEPNTAPPTPPDELSNPAPYYTAAAQVAHQSHRLFFGTAGISSPATKQSVINTAVVWDGYEEQTQTAVNDLAKFSSDISNLNGEIRAINPGIKYLGAGIGDFAGVTLMTQAQIDAAGRAIPAGMFSWLNFGPHAGPSCTDRRVCPIPERLDLEIQTIRDQV